MQEYLPITGLPEFCRHAQKLAFGDHPAVSEGRIVTAQALSGTGSLRVASEFLFKFYSSKTIYVCQPTWGNHNKIFPSGGLAIKPYRYYDSSTRGLDYAGMLADLSAAEPGAIVLLHACAHNPTGVDPSKQQWQGILKTCLERRLLCFFDSAYQVRLGSVRVARDSIRLRLHRVTIHARPGESSSPLLQPAHPAAVPHSATLLLPPEPACHFRVLAHPTTDSSIADKQVEDEAIPRHDNRTLAVIYVYAAQHTATFETDRIHCLTFLIMQNALYTALRPY